MKICFVINECNFFYSHRFILAKKLTSSAEVFVLTDTSNMQSDIIEKILASKIKLYELPRRTSKKGVFGVFFYFIRLLNAIQKIKPSSIFFVTLELSFFGIITSWFHRKISCFYLITGLEQYFFNQSVKNKIINFIYKIIFQSSKLKLNSKFIFQNNDNKKTLIGHGYILERQSILIHGSGVDLDNIKFKTRSGLKPISFLFSSRLVKAKGIREFIEAGIVMKKLYPKISLNIAGRYDPSDPDSISEKLFQEIQNLNIFNYLGNIDYDDTQQLYLNADIFILPSYGEGLPKAALEAATSGMPLILSNVSGCAECVHEGINGFVVNVHDALSVKNAMEKFITDPSIIKKMSINSRQLIESKFSIKRISDQYKALLL